MIAYLNEYSRVFADSPERVRSAEKRAFERAVANLRRARSGAVGTLESVAALQDIEKLWMLLMEDLANDDNRLPNDLKARLISIGIWILKETSALRIGMKNNFDELIEINEIIVAGLESD